VDTRCRVSTKQPWHTLAVRFHSATVAASLLFGLASCGGSTETHSDAERFCGEAIARRDTIVSPPLASEEELQATLDFYRLMGRLAPVAIAEEWNDLVYNFETAASLIPGDPESEQLVAMTAYATEPSAYSVKRWLQDNCGLDIPITTIAPQAPEPALTTTVAPPESSQPEG
jgi:hypothetical protein